MPYAANSRTHSAEQIEELCAAIMFYGFTIPVLIDEADGIVAGHGRVMAAQQLGMEEVPVIVARGWSAEKIAAYVIWDNRSTEKAGWDLGVLGAELGRLDSAGFSLSLTGFDAGALGELGINLPSSGGTDQAPTVAPSNPGGLALRFGVPPFTVLSARDGWWQDRKRAWIGLGIKSEVGRGEGSTYDTEQVTEPGLNYYRNRQGGKQPDAASFKSQDRLSALQRTGDSRTGPKRKPNAIPGGAAMPLDRPKKPKGATT